METYNQAALDSEGYLVRLAANGDLEAFNQLVLRYQDIAYHLACAILGETDLQRRTLPRTASSKPFARDTGASQAGCFDLAAQDRHQHGLRYFASVETPASFSAAA